MDVSGDADPQEGCLGTRVMHLHRLVARRFEQELRPLDLSLPQLEILAALALVPGPARPSALAAVLGVERSTMSRNLAAMETRGWITAASSSPTGRTTGITLTDEGRRRLVGARDAWSSAQRAVDEQLGTGAATVLDGWLHQLTAAPAARSPRPHEPAVDDPAPLASRPRTMRSTR